MRIIVVIATFLLSANCYAAGESAPTESATTILSVADITLSSAKLPAFINESTNIIDHGAELTIASQLPTISAQIRSQIANNYPWLNVVKVDNNLTPILNSGFNNESDNVDISQLDIDSQSSIPQAGYYMVGRVSALNATSEETLIDNTSQYTEADYVDIAVRFRIIRHSDKKIIAEFTTAGQAGTVQFINKPNKTLPNIGALQDTAIADLISSTLTQINALVVAEKLRPLNSNSDSNTPATDK